VEPTRLEEFGRIDQTADPGYFIRFLDAACAEESFQIYKRRMTDLLEIREGSQILDLGCGTGDDARQMSKLVGRSGRVVGIDNSQAMISEALQRAKEANGPVEFQVADALELPFADGSFTGCRADRSLMHIPPTRRALAEMLRVSRPGGRLVVYEVDFETVVINADDRVLARKIAHTWCDGFRNGWLGRYLPALFEELGLKEVTIWPHTLLLTPALALPILGPTTVEKAVTLGTITAVEGRTWLRDLADQERTGHFFSTLTGFLVAGRKEVSGGRESG
jgi:ubiquinone/menaquinone biosynthesis C-methylase UbiE